jgi:hypothetical protein
MLASSSAVRVERVGDHEQNPPGCGLLWEEGEVGGSAHRAAVPLHARRLQGAIKLRRASGVPV